MFWFRGDLPWLIDESGYCCFSSHKSSLSNVEKLVTTRSVGSPTMLLLRGSTSESDSLSYSRAENKDLIGPCLRAILSVRGISLRKRGERSVAKLLLRLTSCYLHNMNSVVFSKGRLLRFR